MKLNDTFQATKQGIAKQAKQLQNRYQQLNPLLKRLLKGISALILLLVLIGIVISAHHVNKTAKKSQKSVSFKTIKTALKKEIMPTPINTKQEKEANLHDSYSASTPSNDQNNRDQDNMTALPQSIKHPEDAQLKQLNNQLQHLQDSLGHVASNQTVDQLQEQLDTPNPVLLSKINHLENTMGKLIQQTATIRWISPKTVEHYFRLVAIQGFSDGMRAIIDVNGHQTVLGVNQLCPACRGWQLKRMDFTNQTAVFKNAKNQYVKLNANQ